MPSVELQQLKLPADFASERPHVFASVDSLKWFMRRHRGRLIEAKAISKPAGRTLIDEPAFDRVVQEVGHELAGESA